MAERDRTWLIALLIAAALAWLIVFGVMSTVYPDSDQMRLAVAAAIGLATGLTAAPLAWLAAFGRRGRASRPGDWVRAIRRGTLAGGLAALLATLQLTGTTSLAVVAFAVLLVLSLELVLSYRR
jgi:hypothetical protein